MFTPLNLTKKVSLNHRIVLAPLTRSRALNEDYVFGPTTKTYYEQRATEGGLLITEATCISETARGFPRVPGIYLEDHVKMWKEVVDCISKKGAFMYLQLWHMGRCSSSSFQPNNGNPVSASAVACPTTLVFTADGKMIPMPTPHALTKEEILGIVQDYYNAAVKAKQAGMNGVELHFANGYLIQQFLSSNVNKREDEFGGSSENRARFPLLVCQATVRAWLGLEIDASREAVNAAVIEQYGSVGDAIDVGVRLSPNSTFGGIEEENVEELYTTLIKGFNELPARLAYLHLVEPRVVGSTDTESKEEFNAHSSYFGKLFNSSVISAGGYSSDPSSAHVTVEQGAADLVAFGRSFIANPTLVEKLRLGQALVPWDRSHFYSGEPIKGYIDYE